MCGIFGYIGQKKALPFILKGLSDLEYRGYDSAGVALINEKGLLVEKCQGKVADLARRVKENGASVGIGHTRWATHGAPNYVNSHPHLDCRGRIAVVHNGTIDNFQQLREDLKARGHCFCSETDTEVLPHLLEETVRDFGFTAEALRRALKLVKGSYGMAILSVDYPDRILVARHGSPLIIGSSEDGYFLSSDIPALLSHTRLVTILQDGQAGFLRRDGFELFNVKTGRSCPAEVHKVNYQASASERGKFGHYMLKEIYEQPLVLRNLFRCYVDADRKIQFPELNLSDRQLKKVKRIVIAACGTSWHAGLIAKYFLEEYASVPVEIENAAEFRYRKTVLTSDDILLVISQSGETADTLGALKKACREKIRVFAVCNVPDSSICRQSEGVILTEAGPEIGVASTKAFTSQLAVLYLLGLKIAQLKGELTGKQCHQFLAQLFRIPEKMEIIMKEASQTEESAARYFRTSNALYLGRGYNYPIALEGALKLKEISYIHAEGLPAAEMKHGPIALIDWNMPAVVIAPNDRTYSRVLLNVEEVKARGGEVIAVVTTGDCQMKEKADSLIYIPRTVDPLNPFLTVLPLQLLAYYIAVRRGCNVDQPRNLAKSVTVE
ncbi:MAG: glutamine--fructose-6-phosphate transaminase (isomerizing) [Candidatus Omnitrophota bacterium]|nr:glutamine--fructose-6-phosphate transaminase (isomerizing) [Candidatus Omnitrophota bacterium]